MHTPKRAYLESAYLEIHRVEASTASGPLQQVTAIPATPHPDTLPREGACSGPFARRKVGRAQEAMPGTSSTDMLFGQVDSSAGQNGRSIGRAGKVRMP
jgi:hypothetical protein